MRDSYSLYETKARLSAIIRQVREGRHVTVTLHGVPVAEIRPISGGDEDIASRVEELAARGIVVASDYTGSAVSVHARRPGALKRFLEERD